MDVIHIPVLSIVFLTPDIDFDLYEGIIVTSKQAAVALQFYTPHWDKLKVICVGESTASAMKELGARHVDIADGYGVSILEVLSLHEGRWLYLRPQIIASSWPDRARELGMEIDEVTIYETTCNNDMKEIKIDESGVLIFTSPSSVNCFTKKVDILPTHDVIVIGKTTQKALPLGVKSHLSVQTSVSSCVRMARQIAAS